MANRVNIKLQALIIFMTVCVILAMTRVSLAGLSTTDTYSWHKVTAPTFIQIAAGSDGTVVGLTASGTVYNYESGTWKLISNTIAPPKGGFKQIAVSSEKQIAALAASNNHLYLFNSSGLTTLTTAVLTQISAGSDETLWGLNGSMIEKFEGGNSWAPVANPSTGALVSLSVRSANQVDGVVEQGNLYSFTQNGTYTSLVTPAAILNQISVASDGTLWGIDTTHTVWQFGSGKWESVPPPEGLIIKEISVVKANNVWAVTTSGLVYNYKINTPPAANIGHYGTLAFESDFSKLATPSGTNTSATILAESRVVDVNNTEEAGFQWYTRCWYCSVTPPTGVSIVNVTGTNVLQLNPNGNNSIYGLLDGAHGVVGTSIKNGAYIEVRIAMAVPPTATAKPWPVFWALPNLNRASLAWPGSSSTYFFNGTDEPYLSDVEWDIMEFENPVNNSVTIPEISSTIHNWYGYTGVTCNEKTTTKCQIASSYKLSDSSTVHLESTINAPVFNTFGALWVPWNPLTPTVPGYVQYYFNNQPYGAKTTWIGTPPQVKDPVGLLPVTPGQSVTAMTNPPTVELPEWTMGIMDLSSFGLVFSTGGGSFMDIQWVKVWQ